MMPSLKDTTKIWRKGTCVDKVAPRSCIVEVNGSRYRGNRTFLRSANCRIDEDSQTVPALQIMEPQVHHPTLTPSLLDNTEVGNTSAEEQSANGNDCIEQGESPQFHYHQTQYFHQR